MAVNDPIKIITIDNLDRFKDKLPVPTWKGTRAQYTAAATAGTLPDYGIIGISDEDPPTGGSSGSGSGNVTIVSFASGTDSELKAMLDAAYAGEIDIGDYWSVGDKRTVHHSAIASTTDLEAQAEQDVAWVLMDTGINSGYTFTNGKPVNFVVGTENCLSTAGKMNATNSSAGSWDSCLRRGWLNSDFRASIPEGFRTLFKQFNTITVKEYNATEIKVSEDYFALFSQKEVFGVKGNANEVESEALKQIEYYYLTANRIKQVTGSANYWWLRSPSSSATYFCLVRSNGAANDGFASSACGVAPFGCI